MLWSNVTPWVVIPYLKYYPLTFPYPDLFFQQQYCIIEHMLKRARLSLFCSLLCHCCQNSVWYLLLSIYLLNKLIIPEKYLGTRTHHFCWQRLAAIYNFIFKFWIFCLVISDTKIYVLIAGFESLSQNVRKKSHFGLLLYMLSIIFCEFLIVSN